jgi:hypothetical protein
MIPELLKIRKRTYKGGGEREAEPHRTTFIGG